VYDIVFLSYNETNAEKNWLALKAYLSIPYSLQRVHGVKGILNAHKEAARISKTEYFWVVDADNTVKPGFEFDYHWSKTELPDNPVMVWRAVNSVNGLTYGYGGIKLLPRRAVLNMTDTPIDFTTSISEHFYLNDRIASSTIIDTTPFEAWKAGFRECVKLTSRIIKNSNSEEDEERLKTWTTVHGFTTNGMHCVSGALSGRDYAMNCLLLKDTKALKKINDFGWLENMFNDADES